jgi:hypothetical protein
MISEIEIATSFSERTRNDRRRKELLFFDRLRMSGTLGSDSSTSSE